MEPLLSLRNCSFSYEEGAFSLQDVSLGTDGGELLGIVGPNGSGKSTLMRLMSGYYTPDEGDVTLRGRSLSDLDTREAARELAFLPQSAPPTFEYDVREVVAMGRYPYLGPFGFPGEDDRRAVRQALEETHATELADRSFGTLSGGEKQQVMVASVLAQEPELMLLDEPAASLDIHHQSELMDLLWSLSQEGPGVVIVTHDLNAAALFCDRLALLSEGRLLRTGVPAEVMDEDLLSEVYETELRVMRNPVTDTPMVIVPGRRAHDAR
jgi:iron complex transport system ATP-binding protein